jgi:hypothetical protein
MENVNVRQVALECLMVYVDHVKKERNIMLQQRFVHQFVQKDPFGLLNKKSVFVQHSLT